MAHRTQTLTEATAPVDVAAILMTVADVLREHPRHILTTNSLIRLVLTAAGPTPITDTQLRPVWEALPHHPAGDEHAEYAALLVMTAQGL